MKMMMVAVAALAFAPFGGGSILAEGEATDKITVPQGTQIMVRMAETLDSRQHKSGYRFTAALEADLVADGTVVAPKGSTVYGVLTEAKSSKRVRGKSEFKMEFNGIMIHNQIVTISTTQIQALTEETGKNSAGKVARGAAIGALVDGSSGAKTGAKVGVGVALLTGGEQINIPKGTLLQFQLTTPLTI